MTEHGRSFQEIFGEMDSPLGTISSALDSIREDMDYLKANAATKQDMQKVLAAIKKHPWHQEPSPR